jgi:hypothetical protein
MYVQKDTYTYIHHTDMSVLDTYMSVFNTDKTECACICLNVYVCDFHRDSIVFLLSLYDVCFFGIDTSKYIHACILNVSCLYLACILSISGLYLACIFLLRAVFFSLQICEC